MQSSRGICAVVDNELCVCDLPVRMFSSNDGNGAAGVTTAGQQ